MNKLSRSTPSTFPNWATRRAGPKIQPLRCIEGRCAYFHMSVLGRWGPDMRVHGTSGRKASSRNFSRPVSFQWRFTDTRANPHPCSDS